MTDTRERIVGAAADLFRRQGYTGTGVKQVVSEAHAPFGSLYHFFPGGKAQLGEAVIRAAGAEYGRAVAARLAEHPDPVTAVREGFAHAAGVLEDSDYADACPIATVALEVASTDERLRAAVDDVFTGWIDALTAWFAAGGVGADHARRLAVEMLTALEGAFVLCRATRRTEALHVAGALVAASVERALQEG